MATLRSPQPSPSGVGHTPLPRAQKPSKIPASWRATSSGMPSSHSHSHSHSQPSGIPTFRSIRSLLPFGPNKEPTPISNTSFSSVRKSLGIPRKVSLTEQPVIDIGRPNDDIPIRKSMSLTALEKPLPPQPEPVLDVENDAELSTIIEADTSGVSMSKHLPSASNSTASTSSSPIPSPLPLPELHTPNSDMGNDSAALNLSTTDLTAEVLTALVSKRDSSGWRTDAQIVDEDDDGDTGKPFLNFNFDTPDPDLAALLSPNRLHSANNTTIIPKRSSKEISPSRSNQTPSPTLTFDPPPSPKTSTRPRLILRRHLSSSNNSINSPESDDVRTRGSSTDSIGHPPTVFRRAPQSPLSAYSPARSASPASSTPAASATSRFLSRMTPSRSSIDVPSTATSSVGGRKRSMSVEQPVLNRSHSVASYSSRTLSSRHLLRAGGGEPPRPMMCEWLGPRTAKAFKAAGLLGDEDHSMRFGFGSTGGSEYGARTPSRVDTGRSSFSYSRNGGSVLGPSPSTTSPTLRSVSTAPTSVSWDEIAELKEKHATETGVLLSALSDSQRTVRVLREENAELRDRMAVMDSDFEKLGMDFERVQRDREILQQVAEELRAEIDEMRRMRMRASKGSPLRAVVHNSNSLWDGESVDDRAEVEEMLAPSRTRRSSTSSVFLVPPSNMSMLMQEDETRVNGEGSVLSFSPPQAEVHDDDEEEEEEGFSLRTGSPGSLFLRPEHEMHLGDLEHLDIGGTSDFEEEQVL